MVPPPPYKDYIPGPDADAFAWMGNMVTQFISFGMLIPDPVQGALDITAFGDALTLSQAGATRGPASIQAKDDARAVAQTFSRLAAQAIVAAYRNGTLTAQQVTDSGCRVPSDVQTPRLPPAAGPDLLLRNVTPGMINLSVQQPGSSSFAKPIGVVGAELWGGAWSGDPLAPPAELSFLGLMTRKNFSFATLGQAGTQFLLGAKWLTVRGAVSPLGSGINVYAV